jgi:hypothetical protein
LLTPHQDLVENIEPGVAQHMASNALSLIRTLTAPESDLSSLAPPSPEHPDALGPSPPSSVFFSYLGAFILVPLRSARLTAAFLLLAGADLALRRGAVPDPAPALRGGSSMRIAKAVGAGALVPTLAVLGALLGANTVALAMGLVNRRLSWFTGERLPILLYGPPALAGALALPATLGPAPGERAVFAGTALAVLSIGSAMLVAELGSGVVFLLAGAPVLFALGLDQALRGPREHLALGTYVLGALGALATGVQVAASVLDIFVPLVRPPRGSDARC